ncbi:helix-hairpin-helix domain-containing protein [Conexibacter woesei]|uniref:Competence protein ComEA helix-hairpin-helix repeat protein n=1 Tax=Conexibacter woesei (strain DSM 14684 / CCUG 47730 / CIP 108061 / JCM 11494 / NBRC 100937 / ID131577) TaxID=469383 RepID=D3FAT6_CONWI|nr:helix-hairpin-helix domain-containing protein [Conexibacter woesei]ADB51249.1 competence protein ComEA helix-hairpin-helix repeat protein [Conexibacter woesei DSM 14684]
MPQPTKPQLAIYAAFAIAVLLIGARFLREGAEDPAAAGSSPPSGALGSADGSGSAPPLGDGGAGGSPGNGVSGSGGTLVVDVKGAVRRQGVYRLPAGSRVLDAVRRAGGVTGRADRLRVNLAARVVDGGEVVVPRKGETGGGGFAASGSAGGGAGSSGAAGSSGTAPLALDINTATAQELEQLDGVGPATAAKIVAYREQNGGFRSIDELDEVSGIGEAKMAAIRAQLGQ